MKPGHALLGAGAVLAGFGRDRHHRVGTDQSDHDALHRGLVFGVVARPHAGARRSSCSTCSSPSNGWCGHLCPVGAFYGLLGKASAAARVGAPAARLRRLHRLLRRLPGDRTSSRPALQGRAHRRSGR